MTRSSRSSVTRARAPRRRVSSLGRSARRWATACGPSRSSRRRSSRRPAPRPEPAGTASASRRSSISNVGDRADLVVAFNEQVLYSRIDQARCGRALLLDRRQVGSRRGRQDPRGLRQGARGLLRARLRRAGDPDRGETLKLVENPQRGKNMWVVGCCAPSTSRDLDFAEDEVRALRAPAQGRRRDRPAEPPSCSRPATPGGSSTSTSASRFRARRATRAMVVMNGNAAVAWHAMAAGIEVCSMYPITPATSASHYLAAVFHKVGGFVHQAEDEIAAVGFAIGLLLRRQDRAHHHLGARPGAQDRADRPGGDGRDPARNRERAARRPATGLPTKVEQGDLLPRLLGSPAMRPRSCMAPSSIEECFHFMITARKLAESFRMPVIVLSDANLATGSALFPAPDPPEDWLAPPVDQSPWNGGTRRPTTGTETGLSQRPIPDRRAGPTCSRAWPTTSRARSPTSRPSTSAPCEMRSRKLAALQQTPQARRGHGDAEGDLLVVGWGSTPGAIEEAVDRIRADGTESRPAPALPLAPRARAQGDLRPLRKVMTVEINYSDDP